MQNFPVSASSPSDQVSSSSTAGSTQADTMAEGGSFADIFESNRSQTLSVSPLESIEETKTTLLNRMGNTLFTGGTRRLNANINQSTGLFSDTTMPRQMFAVSGNTNIHSSFIELDRIRYSGLPSDFAALTTKSGTLSHDDINTLKKVLKEKGAQEASLEALNQLMASGAPLTLSKAMSAITGQCRLHEEMSDDERIAFRLLGNKLGINTLEGDEMLGLSDTGKSRELWNSIASKVADMDKSNLDISRKETEALLKSLDISPETRKFVLGQFPKDEDQITLFRKELEDFFSSVRDEISKRDNAQRHCLSILGNSVNDALAQRQLNEKTDPQSSSRDNAASLRLEARMQESTLQNNAIAGMNNETEDPRQDSFNRQTLDEHARQLAETRQTERKKTEHAKDEKIGTVSASTVTAEKNASLTGLAHVETHMPESSFSAGSAKNLEHIAGQHRQEIFQQVQSGMLKNIPNGTTQITLQLDPKDLGQLSLILTSREGEIRATIRAENAETAAVLSEQLDSLKATLEEQGLKVAELEVKTGLQNDDGYQHWHGTQEHNQMYDAEQRSRAQRLAQLRTEKNSAEQPQATRYTPPDPDGLHIVA